MEARRGRSLGRGKNMSEQYVRILLEEIVSEFAIPIETASVLDIGCSDIRPYSRFLISACEASLLTPNIL